MRNLVVGGEKVSTPPSFFGVMTNKFGLLCGAAFVHPRVAITAAHCCDAGPTSIMMMGTSLRIESFASHPSYERSTLRNDICVVTMRDVARQWGNVSDPHSEVWVVGAGESYQSPLGVIHRAKLDVVEDTRCSNSWKDYDAETQMCCGGDNSDSCFGDSGAPLFVGNLIMGLVSYGASPCGQRGVYSVNTKVKPFEPWIRGFFDCDTTYGVCENVRTRNPVTARFVGGEIFDGCGDPPPLHIIQKAYCLLCCDGNDSCKCKQLKLSLA